MNQIKNTIGMLGIGYAKKEIMAHFRRDHRCHSWFSHLARTQCNCWLKPRVDSL